jgi:excinuclease UvrABC nuclease subunit
VIAISKDDRHRANLIHLSNGTDVSIKGYNEFAHILNEVHRFSLDFHRKRMSKKMFK